MKHMVTKQVADEAGITQPQAEKAVDALIGYFKTRLPEEMNNEIQSLIAGEDEMR